MATLSRRAALVSAAAAVWCWPRQSAAPWPNSSSTFRLPAPPKPGQKPFYSDRFIDHDPPLAYVHCPSICTLPDGRMACAWYAGSREGARDVAIWIAHWQFVDQQAVAINPEGTWGPPSVRMDHQIAMDDLDRYVKKVGNSVLFTADDRIWLVYVTIAIGGWSGSSLNACSSTDAGKTWSRSQRLIVSPFFNVSELVRAAPVILDTGEIGLPIYHECIGMFPEMLWLRSDGDRLSAVKTRMAGGRSLLQPTVVPVDGRHALAFLRNHSAHRRMASQSSADGGQTWTPPIETDLVNADASVAAVRLSTGHLLVALNNSAHSRDNLSLALSPDGVSQWQLIATLDDQPGEKFAYPYMIQDSQGVVQLVYSWKMKRIRHIVMNEAWLLAQIGKPLA